MEENSLIKLACTQMSADFDKLLLEISNTTDNLPVNSATNANSDIVNSIRADSAAALVDSHHPMNSIVQCDNDISSNFPELPVLALNSKSRKQRRCANYPICNSLAADCKGWKSSTCVFLLNGSIAIPDKDVFDQMKKKGIELQIAIVSEKIEIPQTIQGDMCAFN